jgi:hypothetical protein
VDEFYSPASLSSNQLNVQPNAMLYSEAAFRHELALGRIGSNRRKPRRRLVQAIEDYLAWSKVKHSQKPNSFVRIGYSCNPLKEFFVKRRLTASSEGLEKFVIWRSGQISKKTKQPISRDTVSFELITLKSFSSV